MHDSREYTFHHDERHNLMAYLRRKSRPVNDMDMACAGGNGRHGGCASARVGWHAWRHAALGFRPGGALPSASLAVLSLLVVGGAPRRRLAVLVLEALVSVGVASLLSAQAGAAATPLVRGASLALAVLVAAGRRKGALDAGIAPLCNAVLVPAAAAAPAMGTGARPGLSAAATITVRKTSTIMML